MASRTWDTTWYLLYGYCMAVWPLTCQLILYTVCRHHWHCEPTALAIVSRASYHRHIWTAADSWHHPPNTPGDTPLRCNMCTPQRNCAGTVIQAHHRSSDCTVFVLYGQLAEDNQQQHHASDAPVAEVAVLHLHRTVCTAVTEHDRIQVQIIRCAMLR